MEKLVKTILWTGVILYGLALLALRVYFWINNLSVSLLSYFYWFIFFSYLVFAWSFGIRTQNTLSVGFTLFILGAFLSIFNLIDAANLMIEIAFIILLIGAGNVVLALLKKKDVR